MKHFLEGEREGRGLFWCCVEQLMRVFTHAMVRISSFWKDYSFNPVSFRLSSRCYAANLSLFIPFLVVVNI